MSQGAGGEGFNSLVFTLMATSIEYIITIILLFALQILDKRFPIRAKRLSNYWILESRKVIFHSCIRYVLV